MGLYAEWQEVLTRPENVPTGQTQEDVLRFLRYLAGQSHLQEIHFLWRPFLTDPDDDMVLETAINGSASAIVTFNQSDFASGMKGFSCAVILPATALQQIRRSNP